MKINYTCLMKRDAIRPCTFSNASTTNHERKTRPAARSRIKGATSASMGSPLLPSHALLGKGRNETKAKTMQACKRRSMNLSNAWDGLGMPACRDVG